MRAAASALTAHRLWADVTANNIANLRTTQTPAGGPYQRQAVVMTASPFVLPEREEIGRSRAARGSARSALPGRGVSSGHGVDARVIEIAGERLEYDPHHPHADADGYVRYPDINLAEELVNLIVAQRGYEANLSVFNTLKQMAQRTLDLGK